MSQPQPNTLRIVSVAPGAPTYVGTLVAGTLIINTDANNAVYVGGSTTVSTTVGIRIGPLGSMTWNVTANVWAVVASGVSSPVLITLSDQVDNPNSPLDVAQAIISQGIPSKLLVTTVGTFTIPPASTGPLVVPADLTAYASILVTATGWPLGSAILYSWQAPSGGNAILSDFVYPDGSGNLQIVMPVRGSILTFVNTSNAFSLNVTITGYNRQFSTMVLQNGFPSNGGRWELSQTNWAVSTIKLPLFDGACCQGLVYLNLSIIYASTPSPLPRCYLVTVPQGQAGSSNNATRFVISGGQLQSFGENTNKQFRYGWLGVMPSMPHDFYWTFQDAPPVGVTTISLSIQASGVQ